MRRYIVALVLTCTAATVAAQGAPTARFRFERRIDVTSAGPQRLDPDVTLVAGAQPFRVERLAEWAMAAGGLGDLRLFAGDGSEVPYLLIPPTLDEPAREPLREDMPVIRRQSEPGRSRFRINLPEARLPIVALELTVGGGNLSRNVRVLEASLVGTEARPRLLGQAQLTRVAAEATTPEKLRVQIAQPTEPQLELVADDGDNPPLDLQAVTAVFAELPWIYFEAPGPGSLIARYGDPRLATPRYDLEAARATLRATTAKAAWQSVIPVTLAAEPEALPMPQTGSAVATTGFGYLRDIAAGPAGLIAVPLDAAVLAHSGVSPRNLRDVRVLDRAGLQIPYLLEYRDQPLIVETQLQRRDLPGDLKAQAGRSTSYAVALPFKRLPDAKLVLSTRARVFQRDLSLAVVTDKTERQPARLIRHDALRWVHADEATPAAALTFPLPDASGGDLFLLVDEGDNQPLPIDKVTLLMPGFAVRFFRQPDQTLRMLYGRDDLAAPQYDLQLLAPQVMGRAAEEVNLGPEQAIAGTTSTTFDMVSPTVFWSALALTVVVLLGLVARLIRREA